MINSKKNEAQSQLKLTKSVYISAFAVFILLIGSVAISLFHAAREADRIASHTEQRIVKLEIDRQIEIAQRDQSQISYWNEAYSALKSKPNAKFVETDMADWLWDDFGFQTSLVVTSGNKVIVDVMKDTVLDPSGRQYLADQNADLTRLAVQKYRKHRKKQSGGYMVLAATSRIPAMLAASAFRLVDGELSVITAQAIISDEKDIPVKGDDVRVLLTIKPFSTIAQEVFSSRTNLNRIEILTADNLPDNPSYAPLPNGGSAPLFYIAWHPNAPFPIILRASAPLLIILFTLAGGVIWFVGRRFAQVIFKLEKSEEENRFMAQHDVLTQLPNRGKFDAEVERSILSQNDGEPVRFAIMSVDLDRFKAVNDTFGHQAGDVVIKTIAARMSELVRKNGMVARMGGDEFACLITENVDRDSLAWLGEAMVETACQVIMFNGGQAQVGASIGISIWPVDGNNLNEMMRMSDLALYQAKESGRGKICFADNVQKQIRKQSAA